jgi:hypothetical protein
VAIGLLGLLMVPAEAAAIPVVWFFLGLLALGVHLALRGVL